MIINLQKLGTNERIIDPRIFLARPSVFMAVQNIQNGQNISLIGSNRSGRSSTLFYLYNHPLLKNLKKVYCGVKHATPFSICNHIATSLQIPLFAPSEIAGTLSKIDFWLFMDDIHLGTLETRLWLPSLFSEFCLNTSSARIVATQGKTCRDLDVVESGGQIQLPPFTVKDTMALIKQAGESVPIDIVESVVDAAKGNPAAITTGLREVLEIKFRGNDPLI